MSQISSNQRKYTGEYTYPTWFTKHKYVFCQGMIERLRRLVWIHTRSTIYYEKRHFRIFIPNITITALSGIASFLSTSQFIENDVQRGLGIAVGVMTSISALVQSVASVTRYSAKAESHQVAADQYTRLLTRLKFEIEMPNEEDFLDSLEESILEIQNKCNYFPPQFIVNSYTFSEMTDPMDKADADIISPSNDSRDHVLIDVYT